MIRKLKYNHKPHLFTGDHKRHATWLELFFDLVFVVAVSELSLYLSHHLSLRDTLIFVGLFIPVWWAWTGHTVYSTRYYSDDIVHLLLTFAQMILAIGMAVQIHYA